MQAFLMMCATRPGLAKAGHRHRPGKKCTDSGNKPPVLSIIDPLWPLPIPVALETKCGRDLTSGKGRAVKDVLTLSGVYLQGQQCTPVYASISVGALDLTSK